MTRDNINWNKLEASELKMVLQAVDANGTRYEISTQNSKWFADGWRKNGNHSSREISVEAAKFAAAKFRKEFKITFDGGLI